MFDRLDDTIVAISSPAGVGVRGILRLSGPGAIALADRVFVCAAGGTLADVPGHRRVAGRLSIDDCGSVPGDAYVFREPASYTRQDVVELHTVGSPPVLAIVLAQLTQAGARVAEPGEFTARAFFSGAMDLTRVEGVAAIIHANNDSQLRASEALLHGELSRRTTALRDRLADLLALIEAQIDFAEEPIDFISSDDLVTGLSDMLGELSALIEHAPSAERLEMLPRVALIGWPNAGKSTLFNRLTGLDRAIQSSTPRTTRDVLTSPVTVPGGEIMLSDSAGVVAARDEFTDEKLEKVDALAEAASRRSVALADLILLVVDMTDRPLRAVESFCSLLPDRPFRVVLNKMDLVSADKIADIVADMGDFDNIHVVSAQRGIGIDSLTEQIGSTLFFDVQSAGSDMLALSDRHREALCEARDALSRACDVCRDSSGMTARVELIALEIREAVSSLSLLIGDVTTEELLARIFFRFCIGK